VIESLTNFVINNKTCGSWLASDGALKGSTETRPFTVSLS